MAPKSLKGAANVGIVAHYRKKKRRNGKNTLIMSKIMSALSACNPSVRFWSAWCKLLDEIVFFGDELLK
jgi:hypothetical protein